MSSEDRGEALRLAAGIRLAAFDVDGVLTDGSLILGANGEEQKIFNVHDGLGLVMLREAGIEIAVISARRSKVVDERMAALGITSIFQGQSDKRTTLAGLLAGKGIPPEHAAYTGDDLVDLPAMAIAGLPAAVADAHPLVRRHARFITRNPGGRGAAREVCELILEGRGMLEACYQRYLQA